MISKMGALFDWPAQKLHSAGEVQAMIEQRRATFTKMGIAAGARVLLPATSSPDFFASLLALWSLRASVIPLDTRLTEAETSSLTAKAKASHVLPERIDLVTDRLPLTVWPEADAQEALILFTTGTLSVPRGVILSSRSIANKVTALGKKLSPDDVRSTLCFLPVSFGHGLIGNCLGPWLSGADLTVMPPLDVASAQSVPEILRSRKISFFSSVPGVWALLARMIEPVQTSAVKRIFCASAPLGENTFKAAQRLFPGVPFHNVYGLTEMASWVAISPAISRFKPGNVGFPFDGELKLDAGEISVRGDSRMNGYLDEPSLPDGEWFKTLDIAAYDDDSGYTLLGRTGHIVNKGGVKVQLEEIDSLLAAHPNVREALCFKTEDKEVGENFEAGIVMQEDSPIAREALQAWFVDLVSPQRRPSRWHFLEALPVNARGKPDRAALKQKAGR